MTTDAYIPIVDSAGPPVESHMEVFSLNAAVAGPDVYDEGSLVATNPAKFNFAGAGVTASESPAGTALITIPGAPTPPAYYHVDAFGATVSSSTLASFSTPWKKDIPVVTGQSVIIHVTVSWSCASDVAGFFSLNRNGVEFFKAMNLKPAGVGTDTNTAHFHFVDATPGNTTFTYEVFGATLAGGTLTLRGGGSSGIGHTLAAYCCMSFEVVTLS